jgi:outer membrane protein OmpA-like peptidoglycan-associated protein
MVLSLFRIAALSLLLAPSLSAQANTDDTLQLYIRADNMKSPCRINTPNVTLAFKYSAANKLNYSDGEFTVFCPKESGSYRADTDLREDAVIVTPKEQEHAFQLHLSSTPLACDKPLEQGESTHLFVDHLSPDHRGAPGQQRWYYCAQLLASEPQPLNGGINITLQGLSKTTQLPLYNVLFDNNSTEISLEGKRQLAHFAMELRRQGNAYAVLHGHASLIGKMTYNQTLSSKRAAAVKSLMTDSFHIPEERIKTLAWGETRLRALNQGETFEEQNRRVVLVLKNYQQ